MGRVISTSWLTRLTIRDGRPWLELLGLGEQAAGAVCDIQQMPACSKLYEDELGAAASHLREIRLERISIYSCHIALLSDKLSHSVHRPGKRVHGLNFRFQSPGDEQSKAVAGIVGHDLWSWHPGGVAPGLHRCKSPCGLLSRINRFQPAHPMATV